MRGMDNENRKDSDQPRSRTDQSWTPASVGKAIFTAVFNTALTLGAAALAFYVVAINLMQHGDNTVPVMLSVVAA